jgi:hypothetical protein
VAISNHRLVSFADGQVTFRWRDSADHNKQKSLPLSVDEFLTRFLLHLLPEGFVRIRNLTSASWPTANVPLSCHFAFTCSARNKNRKPNSMLPPSKTPSAFGAAPNAVDR